LRTIRKTGKKVHSRISKLKRIPEVMTRMEIGVGIEKGTPHG
jgi:hypothetical protein